MCVSALDRYAARCVNFVLVVPRIAVRGARSAPRETSNQPRALVEYRSERPWLIGAVLVVAGVVSGQQGPAQFSAEWYQQFRGPYSAPVEPFKIVGNIHYVGGANIS